LTDVKKILLSASLLALIVPLGIAQATVTQTFSFRIQDVKPDGRYTVVFTSNQFWDTAVPPFLASNYLRLPAGAHLQKRFLNKRYYCDAPSLLHALETTAHEGSEKNVLFQNRLAKLSATIKRIHRKLDRKALKNANVCAQAQIGSGTVSVLVYLGQSTTPVFADPIQTKIFLFLGKGTESGAVASFRIISAPDETSALVKDPNNHDLITENGRLAFALNIFDEPTADFGYKLVLPAGALSLPGGFTINVVIPEVHVTTKGLSSTKKKTTCLRHRHGKCVKKKVKKTVTFWFNRPPCPTSGQLSFQAYYGYQDGTSNTITRQVPCP
jgi:hypothetical protein